MTTKKKQQLNLKKILLWAIIPVVVVIVLFLFWPEKENASTATVKPDGLVNLNPPTDEEKAAGDQAKESALEQEKKRNETQPQTSSGKIAVKPIITYAGQYDDGIEVGGYVSGIFETGGTCTLDLQLGSQKKSVTVNAQRNANAVDCPVMIISRGALSAGKWQATITYESPSATGTSEIKNVEVN